MTFLERDTLQALAAGSAVVALLVAVPTVWWQTPKLQVEVDAKGAVAHMELLGEYPSDIQSIEIVRDGASEPLWKIAAVGDFFQIHSVSLVAGDNAVDVPLFHGQVSHLMPRSGATFRLDPSIGYRITICPSALLGLCRTARFELPAR